MMSGKFPLPILLAELSEQLRIRKMFMDLLWIPRGDNVLADELSKMEFKSFSMNNRLVVNTAAIDWLVLPSIMRAGTELFLSLAHKVQASTAPISTGRKRKIETKERLCW